MDVVGSEQQDLFAEAAPSGSTLPLRGDLQPSRNLLAVFEDCHNHIYANEGMLKDRIFSEMVKLLLMKLLDEQGDEESPVRFGVTSGEYEEVRQGRGTAFLARLQGLLQESVESRPDLFAEGAQLLFGPSSLAFVVSRMQNLSLRKSPGDVKGQAFQTFVFRNQRGDRGEFFTPHPVVDLAVDMLAPRESDRVIDPAAGSGGFLVAAVNHVRRQGGDAQHFLRENVRGLEFNPDVAKSASLRLALEGGLGTEVLCLDSLSGATEFAGEFDLVLTNPPFGSKGRLESQSLLARYELGRKWSLAEGRWIRQEELLPSQSPEVLFLEMSVKLLRPNGRMAIVLPDGLLQNTSVAHVRQWLREHSEIEAVVSLPPETFIPYGTGIKTSLVVLRRQKNSQSPIFMAKVGSLGYDVKGQPTYQRTATGGQVVDQAGSPMVADDSTDVAAAFRGSRVDGDRLFLVPATRVNSRLDVEHYIPSDQALVDALLQLGAARLGDLATFARPSRAWSKDAGSEIHYVAISDVDPRTMEIVNLQMMRAHEAPSRATYVLKTGDIVTAVSGASTGTVRHASAMVRDEANGAVCSNGFAVLRGPFDINPLYLLAFFRTEAFQRQVRRLMTGHAIPSISVDDLGSVLVPRVASDKEAAVVGSMEELRTLRHEAMRKGDEMLQLMRDLMPPATSHPLPDRSQQIQ